MAEPFFVDAFLPLILLYEHLFAVHDVHAALQLVLLTSAEVVDVGIVEVAVDVDVVDAGGFINIGNNGEEFAPRACGFIFLFA